MVIASGWTSEALLVKVSMPGPFLVAVDAMNKA